MAPTYLELHTTPLNTRNRWQRKPEGRMRASCHHRKNSICNKLECFSDYLQPARATAFKDSHNAKRTRQRISKSIIFYFFPRVAERGRNTSYSSRIASKFATKSSARWRPAPYPSEGRYEYTKAKCQNSKSKIKNGKFETRIKIRNQKNLHSPGSAIARPQ